MVKDELFSVDVDFSFLDFSFFDLERDGWMDDEDDDDDEVVGFVVVGKLGTRVR